MAATTATTATTATAITVRQLRRGAARPRSTAIIITPKTIANCRLLAAPTRRSRPPPSSSSSSFSLPAVRILANTSRTANRLTSLREFATRSSKSKRIDAQQPNRIIIAKRSRQKKNPPPPPKHHLERNGTTGENASSLKRKLLSFSVAFVSLNIFGGYVHADDDCFYYLYPFPFALDVANGPSMLPTMTTGDLYWRDCWSHRFVWLDWGHWMRCWRSPLPSKEEEERRSTARDDAGVSCRRPWRRGDVVTFYSPFTKSIVTKRIVGVGGDSVRASGEYACEYRAASITAEDAAAPGNCDDGEISDECGVPHDARFPIPFCRRKIDEAVVGRLRSQRSSEFEDDVRLTVPPNHVWVEGDNPLRSADSRHFGPLRESALRGRVVWRLWPMGDDDGDRRDAMLGSQRPLPNFARRSEGVRDVERNRR